jgi:protein PhnA
LPLLLVVPCNDNAKSAQNFYLRINYTVVKISTWCFYVKRTRQMNDEEQCLCPKCSNPYGYKDSGLWVCPECAHEWSDQALVEESAQVDGDDVVRDAVGNILVNGDSVTVVKDLKVKGSSLVVKAGVKVKSIQLVESNDDHNISCKIDGMGAMKLKSSVVKKN